MLAKPAWNVRFNYEANTIHESGRFLFARSEAPQSGGGVWRVGNYSGNVAIPLFLIIIIKQSLRLMKNCDITVTTISLKSNEYGWKVDSSY